MATKKKTRNFNYTIVKADGTTETIKQKKSKKAEEE